MISKPPLPPPAARRSYPPGGETRAPQAVRYGLPRPSRRLCENALSGSPSHRSGRAVTAPGALRPDHRSLTFEGRLQYAPPHLRRDLSALLPGSAAARRLRTAGRAAARARTSLCRSPANRARSARRRTRRSLLLAAGTGQPAGDRVPGGGERLRRGGAGRYRAAAGDPLRGDRRPHPRRGVDGTGVRRRLLVLPTLRGPSIHSTAARRAASRPRRRSISTPTASPRVTSSSACEESR